MSSTASGEFCQAHHPLHPQNMPSGSRHQEEGRAEVSGPDNPMPALPLIMPALSVVHYNQEGTKEAA